MCLSSAQGVPVIQLFLFPLTFNWCLRALSCFLPTSGGANGSTKYKTIVNTTLAWTFIQPHLEKSSCHIFSPLLSLSASDCQKIAPISNSCDLINNYLITCWRPGYSLKWPFYLVGWMFNVARKTHQHNTFCLCPSLLYQGRSSESTTFFPLDQRNNSEWVLLQNVTLMEWEWNMAALPRWLRCLRRFLFPAAARLERLVVQVDLVVVTDKRV